MTNFPADCLESLHCSSFSDTRGSLKTFREDNRVELPFNFSDCYIATSPKGVVRGLHFQFSKELPLKYVRPITGCITLISLCLDKKHEQFCKVSLTPMNSMDDIAIIIQPIHAIGYLVETESAEVFVASNVSYQAESELGVSVLSLDELTELVSGAILSQKDLHLPTMQKVLEYINLDREENKLWRVDDI